MDNSSSKRISLFQLIGITMAFFFTVRNVPTVASVGWESIFYMIAAAIFFAIPIALISAELATGWPKEGGAQAWIKVALGERWSFVASWMLWIIMIVGMVMVSSAGASVLAYGIGKPNLSQNGVFITIVTIVAFWVITLLNFKASLGKMINTIATIIGIYIPFTLLVVLGIWFAIKHGNVNLGSLNMSTAFPDMTQISKLSFFSGICFIFTGVELSGVYANEVNNVKRNYPVAIFLAIGAVIVFNLLGALTEANAIPTNKIDLATVIQPFQIYFSELGIPWATNVLGIMIYVGVIAQLSAWVLGPSKEMIKVAEDGNLPKFFQKRNEDGIPVTFVILQAIAISLVSLLYIIVPAINTGYFMVLILTSILYSTVYVFLILSAIVLKYKAPDVVRPFTIPGGKIGMWIVSILGLIGMIVTIGVSFIPSSDVPKGDTLSYVLFQLIGLVVTFCIPLIIFKLKKTSWKKDGSVISSDIAKSKLNNTNTKSNNTKNNNVIKGVNIKHAIHHNKH
ncbi:MAG: APC family permease [Sarcina sp.]